MTKFEKPGRKEWDYPDMARIAASRALIDATVDYKEVQQVCVGYCYGDSTCGQRAVYQLGMTGVPVYNVNNNCATGSSAMYMAKQFVEGGISDCVLALGFEKMERGSLGTKYNDRTVPLDIHVEKMMNVYPYEGEPMAPWMFGNAAVEHMQKYGSTQEQVAKIAEKNHRHSANNPYSQFRDVYSLEQILKSPKVSGPLTKLQCCPTSDGAAACIVASEDFVVRHGLEGQAVEIIGMAMATDLTSTFEEPSAMKQVGFDMSRAAATAALRQAQVNATDVQVVELHDCFSANEFVTYEALGLCGPGEAGKFVDRGDNTYGGRVVVNPSGGLISKGHPLGATGLAQASEICWQLRGEAGPRQVANATLGLTHNLGLGGAAVVTVYKRPDNWRNKPMKRPVSGGMGFAEDGVEGGAVLPSAAGGRAKSGAAAAASPASDMTVDAVFDQINSAVKSQGSDLVRKFNGIVQFNVTGAGGWNLDLKNGTGSLSKGEGKSDIAVTISDKDFLQLVAGKLNAQQAFMKGKIKVKGNMGLAMKLNTVFDAAKPQAKL